MSLDEGFARLAAYYKDHPRPSRDTGSTSLDRVEEVADDQRARAEDSSIASEAKDNGVTTDLQSVRDR